jgi:hypothetical protein
MKAKILTTDAEIDEALERAKNLPPIPVAVSVKYSVELDAFEIRMDNNERHIIPREKLKWLRSSATIGQLSNVRVFMLGTGLFWPDLDVCLFVPTLIHPA